ncbi:MAG: 6-phospho-3-hexuloisomerase [Candidatus Moranbacteria bacterium]|nr:6-phospho-3-hexuloisomerase [Candidatus Moranbacteria bacterium]
MINAIIKDYVNNLKQVLEKANFNQIERVGNQLSIANRVFIYGAGRSGLVGKAFAMRLMHLGIEVFFIGETVTPAVAKGDAILFISGSGNTVSVVNMLKIAKQQGLVVLGITGEQSGKLHQQADYVIYLKTKTKEKSGDYLTMQLLGTRRQIAPMGTTFETAALITLDTLIAILMSKLGKTEADLKKRHANLE